ncbi:SPOR domain-containing protein [Robertkochia flava]|uniref:SPOR domain-containing protein n=1 Tax=Robertkochia flava TaxID=3447986 RepID=UPI001CC9A3FC|nr:SPOR domain-containing protein [Robertkochia marina]
MRFLTGKTIVISIFTMLCCVGISSAQQGVNPTITKGKINIKQDPKIDKLLEAKKDMFQNEEATLYRIQIYNGTLDEAKEVLKEFREDFEDWKADISFELPNYKVRVGRFRTRLEADRKLMEIKRSYPSAFLLEPR